MEYKISSKTRTILCVIVIVLLIIEEYLMFSYIEKNLSLFGKVLMWTLFGFLISLYVFLIVNKSIERPRMIALRKLFQNLASSKLSVLILLFFIVHIQWICNAGYNALFTDSGFQTSYFIATIICTIALIGAVFLYPMETPLKVASERSLIVSGLSLSFDKKEKTFMISPKNIDLLIKPLIPYEWYENNTIVTSSIKKMVIIPSNNELHFAKLEKGDYIFPFLKDKSEEEVEALRLKYNEAIQGEMDSENYNPEVLLKELIFILIGKEIDVTIVEPLDYDDMKKSLNRVNEVLQSYETTSGGLHKTDDTLLYISPGTGVIGAALTSFAIPGNRCVLYYTQTQNENHLVSIGLQTGGHQSIMEEIIDKD